MASAAKTEMRSRLLAARRALPSAERDAEALALVAHLPSAVAVGQTVCAYVPVGAEPGSIALVDALTGLRCRVLLPVARYDDADVPQPLLWGEYTPRGLVTARHGLREPPPPWLPAAEVGAADVVLVPALAVDRSGVRLGRGAGFYDRSLPLAAPAAVLAAVVRDDELVDALPAEPHDVRMTHALTPGAGFVALR